MQDTQLLDRQKTWEASDLWRALIRPLQVFSSPSPFVENSAAFCNDQEAAKALGRSFEEWMTSLQTFYCTAYAIPLESRPSCCGRASLRRPCIRAHYRRASTSPHIANPVAQWWRTLATHLDLLCKLRARAKAPDTINALFHKCHIMSSQFPDDPATLAITPDDRAGWVTAQSTLSSTTLEQLGHIMEAAESNAWQAGLWAVHLRLLSMRGLPISRYAPQTCEASGPCDL